MSTERPYHFTHLLQVSKKFLWSLILYIFFSWFNTNIYPQGRGHAAHRGKNFDVNRNFLSLRSSVASFKSQTTIVSEKSIVLPFSHTKAYQILPCRKIGQGQPCVIIWTNSVVLEHPVLNIKFPGHLLFGSGEDFLGFLSYMGMAAILVMWPRPFEQTFVPPSNGDSIWNLASIGPVVSEEMFKECERRTDGRTDEGQMTDDGGLYIL